MLQELTSNNAQNVNFGYLKLKDAIIWFVDVNTNFVINVEGNLWIVNVLDKLKEGYNRDKKMLKKGDQKHKLKKKL